MKVKARSENLQSLLLAVLQSNYTREHSEATQALLRGFVGDIVEGVASSRGLPEAEVHPFV